MGLLDWFKPKQAASRDDMSRLMGEVSKLRRQVASYDAARNGAQYENIWANADSYDADSANSRTVRHTLIRRSRYEINNNGFSDGIAQTYATDLVGKGPTLRMQTGSQPLNQMIERVWSDWAKAINLRSKLWTMAHAKHSDGEAFGVIRYNPRVNHPIKLDVQLVEADQCQSPWVPYDEPNQIDGVKFDEFGNPLWYEFLTEHPGSNSRVNFDSETEKIPAEYVMHWFKRRRPGQHRGVPEMASTLNAGAAARRWREAILAAAETAADFSVFIKTQQTPDDADPVSPFSEMDITKNMMSFLPMGWDPMQLKAEHPNTQYEPFHKSLVNEQARPKNMPFNKAACDSSSYNYASGRLDHQTYYGSLDVERADCDDDAMDKLHAAWMLEAVFTYQWFGGQFSGALPHFWDWPKHQVADIKAEAEANTIRLTSGQTSHHQLYTDAGQDVEDQITKMAETYGVEESEIRQRLLDIALPPVVTGGNGDSPPEPETNGVNGHRFNGKGVLHAN